MALVSRRFAYLAAVLTLLGPSLSFQPHVRFSSPWGSRSLPQGSTTRLSAQSRMDCYGVLGVSEAADEREIKRAYRRAATKWHPDVNKTPEVSRVSSP